MKKSKNLLNGLFVGLLASTVMLLSGCSDGGSYDPASYATASGTVAMGKVTNAKVCADLNFNNICDTGEPYTITNATPAFAGRYVVRNIPEGTPYQLITEGGVDTLTGRPAVSMRARSGLRNITPITTMVAMSSNPTALTTILDQLSGGQGYDIDISTDPMPPEFLALSKATEEVLAILADAGLSSQDDQTIIIQKIAEELIVNPLTTPGNSLGGLFNSIATDLATGNYFTDFQVTNTNVASFVSSIETLANSVETQVLSSVNVDGVVIEDATLQNKIDNIVVTVLPVGSVSLKVSQISILNGSGVITGTSSVVNNNLTDISLNASSFAKASVTIQGVNTFTPATAKNYADVSLILNVSDTQSNRALEVKVSGVSIAVTATGVVTLTGGTTLDIRGVNSDGTLVVEKSLSSLGNLVTLAGNVFQLDVNLLKTEVESIDGPVGVAGVYTISSTVSGAPGVPASLGLTLN